MSSQHSGPGQGDRYQPVIIDADQADTHVSALQRLIKLEIQVKQETEHAVPPSPAALAATEDFEVSHLLTELLQDSDNGDCTDYISLRVLGPWMERRAELEIWALLG